MRMTIILLLVVIMLLKGFYIYVVNNLATSGDDLVRLQTEANQYKIKNMELHNQYLHDAALTTVNQKARSEGYIDANVIYLQ